MTEPIPAPSRSQPRSSLDWRTELLVVALSAAEAAALWLVADAVFAASSAERSGMPPLLAFALVYLATAIPRWLETCDVWDPTYQIVMAVAVAATTLVAVKIAAFPHVAWTEWHWPRETAHAIIFRPNTAEVPVWGVVATAAYAWWRGKTRAEPGLDAAYLLLRVGTLVTLVAAVVQGAVRSSGDTRAASGAVVVFFAGALLAIALARLHLEGRRGTVTLGPRWLPSILAPLLVVTAAAVFTAGLLSRDLLETILWFLAPLIWALTVVFRLVVLLIAVVAFLLVSPFLWLLAGHTITLRGIRLTTVDFQASDIVHKASERTADVPDPIRYLVATFVLGLVFSGVTRFLLRRRRRTGQTEAEERSTVLPAGDLLALARALLRLLTGRRAVPAADPLAAQRGDPRWVHTVAVRETYGRLLRWSRDRGVPRPTGITPREHETALTSRMAGPGSLADLAMMTDRYNAARYGEAPATAADAEAARSAWQRLSRGQPGRRG